MKTLTKAEEQVMQALWKLKKGFLKDIVEAMPDPKPHSNTVATLLKILMEKEFVQATVYGRMNEYAPLVSKQQYSKSTLSSVVKAYFGGSFPQAVSFLIEENKLSVKDRELLIKQLKNK